MTTVDAVNGARHARSRSVSRKQVAVADRIVLTKLDLAGADAAALLRRVAALNPGAPMLRADHGRIDPPLVQIASLRSADASQAGVDAWLGDAPGHAHDAS